MRLQLQPGDDRSVPGILHIHTNRSDGRSGPDQIAAAAARAGLKFIVFTDHGDATRQPDPPTYRSGVLCLDGVEVSTTGGHYVVLAMPAAPYPLGGEPRDVVEDVRRLGGFGIAAHPDSPKLELRWREWGAPFDGVELVNPDTSWRMWARAAASTPGPPRTGKWYARRRIAFSLLDYPVRPTETIARLVEPIGEASAVYQWVNVTARRRVVAVAGIDAHGMIAFRGDPADGGYSLPLPDYEASFRALSVRVTPDRPLTGDAVTDGAVLVRAIRNGHLFTAVDGIATPASFGFSATNGRATVHEGDEIAAGSPVTLHVRSNAPPSFTTTVWKDHASLSGDRHESEFSVTAPADPAVYWVEIRSDSRTNRTTWLRSNPIYVRGTEPPTRPLVRPPATINHAIVDAASGDGWHVEHDALSAASVESAPGVNGSDLRFRFGLAGGAAVGQFAAAVYDVPPGGFVGDRLTFTARAERPMRVSIQLRGGEGVVDRWQRSVYVDTFAREHTVYFDDCLPVGITKTFKPPLASIHSVMVVVDTTNTKPGTSGRMWIKSAALER